MMLDVKLAIGDRVFLQDAKKCRKMSKVVAAFVWRSHFFFVILHVEN